MDAATVVYLEDYTTDKVMRAQMMARLRVLLVMGVVIWWIFRKAD